ncbi:MAG: hypothetical protein HYY26_06330 [Acidobacteria bacterium]|nr:hypothetical protein [Acidobacteriota bacterium]
MTMPRVGNWRSACAAVVFCLLAAGCDGPIVHRSPEALYSLAKEQITNGRFTPATDTLARLVREAPESEPGRRAQVLHVALLGAMARGYQQVGESYLAGHHQAAEKPEAPVLRTTAMDYFGQARGRSLEMLEALDRLLAQQAAGPWRLDFLPETLDAAKALGLVEHGQTLADEELARAEQEAVRRALAELLASLVGAEGDVEGARRRLSGGAAEINPAIFYLKAAEELAGLSRIYEKEALGDQRMARLYTERAAALARRAGELARARGDTRLAQESDVRLRHYQEQAPKP